MISKVSNRIMQTLYKKSIISYEEKELYVYGLFMIISYVTFFLVSIFFGMILNILFSSVIFYIGFCFIRNFAGGIHANSEIKCNVITTISIFISELFIKFLIDSDLVVLAFIMLVVSSICLSAIKPIATAEKKVSQQERVKFHKTVKALTILSLIISVIGLFFNRNNILISLSVGLSLASVLLILGKVKCLKNQNNNLCKT